jgi:electron transfer flavoprotein alpha subunit
MSRLRRDPRAERAACAAHSGGRLRLIRGRSAERPRRDPRLERAAAESPGAAGRRRVDWSNGGTGAPLAAPEVAAPSVRIVVDPAFLVFAVVDAPGGHLTAHDRQTLAAAHLLVAPEGAVVMVGAAPSAADEAGADRLLSLEATADPDARADRLVELVAHFQPRHVLWPESEAGGDLARRTAVRLGESLFCGAEQINAQSVRRPAQGRRVERRAKPLRLITLADGAVTPYAGLRCEAKPLDAPPLTPRASALLSVEDAPADPAATPLGEADFVVSAGNGVTDFDAFRALARALGATPGASRMVCDAGLMPRDAQVGASGTVLAARCYFALGIAGAPQHLQGVANCEQIVAVNTDLHAAMIARAALAVVADAQAVMPALLALLEAEAP